METREEKDARMAKVFREISAARVARGVCRHCEGPVPCWSEFGDHAPGVRHTTKTLRARYKGSVLAAVTKPQRSR